ncbi:MAG: SH3 domain-containing protein [Lachnospiraceae bacterium]|nr:SH3 domain-containing protein [Lachnospiraceae bacterium]
MNVRIAPRTTAALHGTFPELLNGTQVRVTGETLGTEDLRLWYQVTLSDNSTAFIRSDLVNPVVISNYTAWNGKAQSTTGTVNIRSAATVNSSLSQLHAPLSNGDSVTVTGETMGSDGYRWYSVSIDDTAVGYCRCDLIVPAYKDYYEEWYATIQTGTGSGNLRVGPGTNYNTVTGSPFANGTLVHIEGEADGADGYVWYQLTELSGYRRGYIRADLVQAASNYPNWAAYAETVTGTLNIRSGPGTGFALSNVVSSVSNGRELTVISQTLGTDLKIWYQVKVDGVTAGYVRSDLVIAARPKAYAEWTATAASNTGVVNIRSGPSTNTAVISGYPQMNNGDQCTVYGQVEGPDDGMVWYKVKVMNTWFGYVRADLLSHGTTVTVTHGYAKWNGKLQGATQNVNIRTDAGTGYDIAATLPNGTNVEVIGTKNGADNYVWYQVRTSGAAGYVRSDLVVHAGDTIGDNPYTVVSWQGRMVTNQAVNVYDYPMATEEASYPVPMGTYFLISEKVFDSNGGVWYHGTAEDGVVDQNNNPVSGFIRESEVKVFPKATECQNDNDTHEYYYPDGNVLEECSKCGKHVRFLKADREMEDLFHLDLTEGKSIGIANSVIYGNLDLLIDIEDMIDILYDIESAYYDYCTDNDLIFTKENMVYAICAAIRKGHYDDFKWDIVLAFQSYSQSFADYIDTRESELKAEYKRIILGEVSRGGNIVNRKIYVLSAGNVVIDWRHMIATMLGYSMDIPIVPKPWYGWAADAATFADNVSQAVGSQYEYAMSNLFNSEEAGSGSFSYQALMADVDAIGVSELISEAMLENNGSSDQHVLSYVLSEYFSSPYLLSLRKTRLMQDVFWNNTVSYDINEFSDAIYYSLYRNHPLGTAVNVLFGDTPPQECNVLYMNHYHGGDDSVRIVSNVMAKYILSENASFGSEY